MQKEPKIQVFGHFVKFGWFDGSLDKWDIAYSDRYTWSFPTDMNQGADKGLNICIISMIICKKSKK